jgi:hypothetical protein
MRVVYRDINGVPHMLFFNDLQAALYYVKIHFPFRDAINDARRLKARLQGVKFRL